VRTLTSLWDELWEEPDPDLRLINRFGVICGAVTFTVLSVVLGLCLAGVL
jgi:hypothetical protein